MSPFGAPRLATHLVYINAPSSRVRHASAMSAPIRINRAPVLTLWASVVAERLGFDRDAALTLGRAVAGRAYGLYEEFRPSVPAGMRGWGAAGQLDLGRLAWLAE